MSLLTIPSNMRDGIKKKHIYKQKCLKRKKGDKETKFISETADLEMYGVEELLKNEILGSITGGIYLD